MTDFDWESSDAWRVRRTEEYKARKAERLRRKRHEGAIKRGLKRLRYLNWDLFVERQEPKIPHGTDAGYFRHRRLKQKACGPCLAAHNQKQNENRRKRGA